MAKENYYLWKGIREDVNKNGNTDRINDVIRDRKRRYQIVTEKFEMLKIM